MCARDAHKERDCGEATACGHQEMATQSPLPIAAVTELGGAFMPFPLCLAVSAASIHSLAAAQAGCFLSPLVYEMTENALYW